MVSRLNDINGYDYIQIKDQQSANTALEISNNNKTAIFINKTRMEVAQNAADRGQKFRIAMITSSIIATCAVAVKIAIVAGAIGIACTPVGWVLGGIAALTALVGIGILIHRHIKATEEGYNPQSLQELGIGLCQGAIAGVATAVTIIVIAIIVGASGGRCGGGGGGGGNFFTGFVLGHSLAQPHWYVRPIHLYPDLGPRSFGSSNHAQGDVADERFENRENVQYLYRNDKVMLAASR